MGTPAIIQSDHGPSFDNELFHAALLDVGTEIHHTTPYHHESNGIVERLNRTIEEMIRTAIEGHTSMWGDVLWAVVHAYNSAVHTSTGVAPAAAMLRSTASPLDRFLGNNDMPPLETLVQAGDVSPVDDFVAASQPATKALYDGITTRSQRATMRQQKQHDKRVTPISFAAGADVFVYAEGTDGTNKLAAKWRGPRKVRERVSGSAVLYIVDAPPESYRDSVVVHVDHLRPCDASRLLESERAIVNRRADTFIPERVIAHRGTGPQIEFLILWRGWGLIRSSWEPLAGRSTDGKPSGVGNVDMVRAYIALHSLDNNPPTAARGAASGRARGRATTGRRNGRGSVTLS